MRYRVVPGLLVLALVVGACGGTAGQKATDTSAAEVSTTTAAPKPARPATLAAAARSTREAGSVALDVEMKVESAEENGSVRFNGVADLASGNAEFTMEAFGDFVNEPDLGEATTMRIVDGTVYVKVTDDIAKRLAITTPWLSATVEQVGLTSGDDPLSGLTNFTNPGGALDALREVSGDVTNYGTVERDGVKVTWFHTELGLADYIKSAGEDAAMAGAFLALLGGLKMPLDVYVDERGFVREFVYAYDFSALDNLFGSSTSTSVPPAAERLTMTFKFSDFGEDVNVEAPPADEVTPLPEGEELFPD